VPALFSGALAGLAGLMVFRYARLRPPLDRRIFHGAACFLLFVGLDDIVGLHEWLEKTLQVDWQILYLPLAAMFAWGLWQVTGLIGQTTPTALMLYTGAGAWLVAQALEAAAWNGIGPALIGEDRPAAEVMELTHSLAYYALMIPEELLEMCGALLFAVGFARLVVSNPAVRQA
jgi:hypothetical protein